MTSCITALIVAVTGLAIGSRRTPRRPVMGGLALIVFFANSLS